LRAAGLRSGAGRVQPSSAFHRQIVLIETPASAATAVSGRDVVVTSALTEAFFAQGCTGMTRRSFRAGGTGGPKQDRPGAARGGGSGF
jgi:hypothetical protein